MLHFNINHSTTFYYDNEVFDIKNLIKTYPVEDDKQKVSSHMLSVTHNPKITINKDAFGNKFGVFTVNGPTRVLNITSEFDIQTFEENIYEKVKRTRHTWEDVSHISMDNSFQIFLNHKDQMIVPEIQQAVQSFDVTQKDPLDVILEFNSYVNRTFRYVQGITNIYTPVSQVWAMKAGVCQDFAVVLIEMLRTINIPARYVSGYICPNNNGMKGDGATHAWVDAYVPNFGWLGVDPTNNCIAQEKHVRVASGRDYDDVSPVKGTYKGRACSTMEVKVTIGYR